MENEEKESADTQATPDNAQNHEQKTENKNEEKKIKKSVAQKGENGEIIFKNQDELDGFINRMYAKGAKKAEQEQNSKQVQETQTKQEDRGQEEPKETAQTDYTDKIALAMAKVGVDVRKVERAAKLVDMSKVLENGVLNTKKLEDEINLIISEFPELKTVNEEVKGFKFGATQSNSDENQKSRKPVATKRWNRFNSF